VQQGRGYLYECVMRDLCDMMVGIKKGVPERIVS
jgi:hypothetical protein